MYEAADLGDEIRSLQSDFSYSAEELEQVESRLDLIYRLRKKYGVDCEEILNYLESARQELDDMEYASDRIAQLQEKLKQADHVAQQHAMRCALCGKRPRQDWSNNSVKNSANWTCRGFSLSVSLSLQNLAPLVWIRYGF